MYSYLFFGITYAFAAAVQPGPLQTYIISQTLKKGWRATLPAALAPVISDGPILLLVIFVLTTIPQKFIILLRIGGGLFLLYLAYLAFQSWRNFDTQLPVEKETDTKTLMGAVVVNLLNPNPYLGWSLIMGPLLLEGWQIAPINGISLIAGFYMTMIFTLAGIITLFSFARRLGPAVSKVLIGLSSLALLGFGIYQLWIGTNYYF